MPSGLDSSFGQRGLGSVRQPDASGAGRTHRCPGAGCAERLPCVCVGGCSEAAWLVRRVGGGRCRWAGRAGGLSRGVRDGSSPAAASGAFLRRLRCSPPRPCGSPGGRCAVRRPRKERDSRWFPRPPSCSKPPSRGRRQRSSPGTRAGRGRGGGGRAGPQGQRRARVADSSWTSCAACRRPRRKWGAARAEIRVSAPWPVLPARGLRRTGLRAPRSCGETGAGLGSRRPP